LRACGRVDGSVQLFCNHRLDPLPVRAQQKAQLNGQTDFSGCGVDLSAHASSTECDRQDFIRCRLLGLESKAVMTILHPALQMRLNATEAQGMGAVKRELRHIG
jgi:hypothetical protein